MGRFYETQMRRFKLLGASKKAKEDEPMIDPMPEPSEEEKKQAQAQKRKMQKMEEYSNIFAKMGNPYPELDDPDERLVETDDDVLLAGLRAFETY
tara:strand:+ start:277 stop:561 length:285 start_codon:yes stop_codon:yes gene_type:complete